MGFLQDVRFGLRVLGKSPGFTLVAVLTLALGTGVNSTVFTIINAVFFKGLPFDNPGEIMWIRSNRGGVSYPDFLDIREQSRSLKGIGAYSTLAADLSDKEAAAERVAGATISFNTFSVLGTRPLIGRDFTAEDAQSGAEPVALLGYGLWQTRYAGDPAILGRVIRIDLRDHTIIGVMQQNEGFPQDTRIWIPLVPEQSNESRSARYLQLFGRLGEGISIEQARAELSAIAQGLAHSYPETNKDIDNQISPFTERGTTGPIRVVLLSMQGAVGFVLLIACANVANLLLSRAAGRVRETSIRTALGATRWRVIKQLLIESVMMSFMGGFLGLGFAFLGLRWFDAATATTGRPYWLAFTMDYRVFLYFLAICVLTGILFGIAPALQISRTRVSENLKEGGRGTAGSIRARRLTGALVVGEICLTAVLLVGAGLMIRSFLNTQRFDIGVDTRDIMTVQIAPPAARYPEPADRLAFQELLSQRLNGLPAMSALAVASHPPAGGAAGRTLQIQGRDLLDENNRLPTVARLAVVPGYFETLNLTMRRGRDFMPADGAPDSEVVIVNETFAERYFPGEEPLGKRVRLGQDTGSGAEDPNAPWLTVVGVSRPVYQQSPNNDLSVQPTVYVPFRQEPTIAFTVLARSSLPRETVIAAIREELRRVDADLPLYNIRSLDDIMAQRSWPYRVFGTLFTSFALIGLVISAVGIYAVTAYSVGQRRQEIGIRMALGAGERDILWLVLRQGMRRIVIGLALGLLAAFGVSRVLATVLVNLTATDPVTFASISTLLAAVTVVACLVPARRAMRLDPIAALRTE